MGKNSFRTSAEKVLRIPRNLLYVDFISVIKYDLGPAKPNFRPFGAKIYYIFCYFKYIFVLLFFIKRIQG